MDIKINTENLKNDIISNIQCPVCFIMCDIPLMSCENGHFICKKCLENIIPISCRIKDKSCPQCRSSGFLRNVAYEKIVNEMLNNYDLKCPFSDEGCSETYKFGNQKTHLNNCKFFTQKFNCPCVRCTELNIYTLPNLLKHMIPHYMMEIDDLYSFTFIPSLNIGPLDTMIKEIINDMIIKSNDAIIELSYETNEIQCSYDSKPIMKYSLSNNATFNVSHCVVYPPVDFYNNFKKEDILLDQIGEDFLNITNYTFFIDTNQIYLIRTTCSINSEMVFYDGIYLNTQYILPEENKIKGFIVSYKNNIRYTNNTNEEINNEITPPNKKRKTLKKMEYLGNVFSEFENYNANMSEEILHGNIISFDRTYTKIDKYNALSMVKWYLVYE